MGIVGVRADRASGRILGLYTVAVAADLARNCDADTEIMVPVSPDHPVLRAQHGWRVADGQLAPDPDAAAPRPAAPPADRLAALVRLLVAELNVLRDRAGLPPLTEADLTRRLRAGAPSTPATEAPR